MYPPPHDQSIEDAMLFLFTGADIGLQNPSGHFIALTMGRPKDWSRNFMAMGKLCSMFSIITLVTPLILGQDGIIVILTKCSRVWVCSTSLEVALCSHIVYPDFPLKAVVPQDMKGISLIQVLVDCLLH